MAEEYLDAINSLYTVKCDDVQIVVKINKSFNTRIDSVSHVFSPSALHTHLDYELFFVTEGKLRLHEVDNMTDYSDCVVCVPPLFEHYSQAETGIYRFLFSFRKVSKKPSALYDALQSVFYSQRPHVFPLGETMRVYIRDLETMFSSDRLERIMRIRSIVSLIIFGIVDEATGSAAIGAGKEATYDYSDHIEYIFSREYDRALSVKYVADKLHLSTRQVSRLIKKYYNASFSEVLVKKRLSIACYLLIHTDLKVSEIIRTVNFETENYFYTVFRKEYGTTPLRYRRQNRLR